MIHSLHTPFRPRARKGCSRDRGAEDNGYRGGTLDRFAKLLPKHDAVVLARSAHLLTEDEPAAYTAAVEGWLSGSWRPTAGFGNGMHLCADTQKLRASPVITANAAGALPGRQALLIIGTADALMGRR